ncbi:MAG: uxaC [Naasia sp.]|jgi:glucuronate isomerase|uniref:glucuronate isomerase n=1 Tax=Naasia sp. TaxID=2546198 RepID=UPI00261A9166|nr:glucuronate isomerase [Naasia sp.]MCU1569447.1 uxaC [Naasia sp.]
MSGLGDDRLLPAEPSTRAIARRIFAEIAELPIISPHSHVDAGMLATNRPFADPAELFVTADHYVTRLLHASGVDLARLGVGPQRSGDRPASREIWRLFCEHWPVFSGTASGLWIEATLRTVFEMPSPSAATADALYEELSALLRLEQFRPQALLNRFGIEVIATTDDPLDDLRHHRALGEDPAVLPRIAPTFRPDPYIDPSTPGWAGLLDRLGEATGRDTHSHAQYLAALTDRRQHFRRNGAFSADLGVHRPQSLRLDDAAAAALFSQVRSGGATSAEHAAFRAHMLYQMARMSAEDGLVMTLHPGVFRNHHRPTLDAFGPDSGHDLPVPTTFVEGLRPILEDFGTAPGFHLVLFTVDETTWSRELAPLAGFYPSVYLGAPWWFLDAPDALQRFRSAVTETAGFSRYSGFIDDTRALCSIPVRHDTARRVDAAYLARLVAEHRLTEDRAIEIAIDTVARLPRKVFKL